MRVGSQCRVGNGGSATQGTSLCQRRFRASEQCSSGEQTPLLDYSSVLCGRLRSGDQGLDECFPGILFKVVLPNKALFGGRVQG